MVSTIELNKVLENDGLFVEEQEMQKNNVTVLGWVVKKVDNDNLVCPTVYPETFENDSDLIEFVRHVYDKKIPEFDLETTISREYILANVIAEVVSSNSNITKNALVHPICEDLSVVYRISVFQDGDSKGSILISEDLAKRAGVTEKELFDIVSNFDDYKVRTIEEVLMGMIEDMPQGAIPSIPLYVVTSDSNVFGASVLCSNFLDKITEKVGDGFTILPSSIYEVLVIPKGMEDFKSLLDMVVEVNDTQVEKEEKLADSVYRYTIAEGLHKVA